MPELPEVETIKIGLAKLLPGHKIMGVEHNWAKSFPNSPEDVKTFLIGAKALAVKRRAKVLLIELDSKYTLVIHLKMTGQLVFVAWRQKPASKEQRAKSKELERFGGGHPSDSLIGKLPDKYTRVIFKLDKSANLFFNDQRKFGWVRLIPTTEVPNIDFFKKVGPEPLAASFTAGQFTRRVKRRAKSIIKAALLDQTVIAGIGNIYADESLWASKIHPQARVNTISTQKLNILFTDIRMVLKLAIKKGGSTDKNYVDAEGNKGSYLKFAKVFRRQDQPCPRCNHTIIKIRVAGRGTHLCPHCQMLPLEKKI